MREELKVNVKKENKDFLLGYCGETGNDINKITDDLIKMMKKQYEMRFGKLGGNANE